MQVFKDVLEFIKSLTFIDYIFFFAVVILLILIITLIYFIKSNDDIFETETDSNDLKEITKQLEKEKPRIEFTEYEKDQEDKAIISYDELLSKKNLGELNYEEEKDLDGLSVKKVNLDDTNINVSEASETPKVRLMSYQNEEKFLESLKALQNLLN